MGFLAVKIMKFISKPFEAVQWFNLNDHPAVVPIEPVFGSRLSTELSCPYCSLKFETHGRLLPNLAKSTTLVCPSSWLVQNFDNSISIYPNIYFSQMFLPFYPPTLPNIPDTEKS